MLLAVVAGASCSRSAEIEQPPEGAMEPRPQVPLPEGGVPLVEGVDLGESDSESCLERAGQPACGGANDFSCNFGRWLQDLVETCQLQTDCHTDGWVEVQLSMNGCASELRMEDPDAPFVECMAEQLRAHRCPCRGTSGGVYLGLGHDGCLACGTGELRCPVGFNCREGRCVEETDGAGGAG